MPGRRVGREGEQDAEPEHRRDDDGDGDVAADPGHAAGEGDRQRRDRDRRRRPEQQRDAGEGRDHQPGEDRVGERLRRIGELVEDDPAAERARGDADQSDLGERPLHEGFLERLDHRQWW